MFETLQPVRSEQPAKAWMIAVAYGFWCLIGALGFLISFLRYGTSRPWGLICSGVIFALAIYFFIAARSHFTTQRSLALHCGLLLILAELPPWLPKPPAKKIPVGILLDRMVHRSTLAEPGGRPFYLKATISDRDDDQSQFNGTVEEYWLSPTKWRRVVKLRDFSQTRIVNGDEIYEDNNGDYFPVDDEILANEIVDPLPKSAVDLVKKLDLVVTEPGPGVDSCVWPQQYFKDADGQEKRVQLAYNCRTGLLVYLSSPTSGYGVMTDYRKFHNKSVAFATQDNPINIRIDTLRDLDTPDERLFAIAQPTPLAKRITTKKISATDARKLIVQKGEILWPAGAGKPNTGSISVNIVIGRDGRVKEASTYSPVDNATEDAALTAVRKWTFSPQMVDGVPAQIETTLTLPFADNPQNVAAGRLRAIQK